MKTVLIANRGEIALRVARACRDVGMTPVGVYADADADAMWLRGMADAYALPGTTAAETYLNIPALLEIGRRAGVDAVHPGYGFLSESAVFAQAVVDAGLIWIGPPAAAIARLGDKIAARAIARAVGAPLVPGSDGPVASAAAVHAFVREHGLPVAIKAAAGGGGRGMRVVHETSAIDGALAAAASEAAAAFGNDACYVERFLDRPRHLEAQILADQHGAVVVVGLRDCSLQRRHQKLIEEAPPPDLSPDLAARIIRAAGDICRAAGYIGAGTVEFLLGDDGLLSFLEVNTRLQVEHPVTEETTGLDLVVEQLRIAQGLPLSVTETPPSRGHAIEFRINAEDPARGFLPMPGQITRFDAPAGPGVRLDSGVEAGSLVPAAFDSLMAKLIVTGPTRAVALARARRALSDFRIEGVPSVIAFARAVLDAPAFNGTAPFAVHTGWIETEFATPLAAALRQDAAPGDPLRLPVTLDGRRCDLSLGPQALARLRIAMGGLATALPQAGAAAADGAGGSPQGDTEAGDISAPVWGRLTRWLVRDGDDVTADAPIAVIEAMKMEMTLTAPRTGRLKISTTTPGLVSQGDVIGRVDPAGAA